MAGINVHFRDSGNALQSQVFGTEQTAFLLWRLGPNATVNAAPSGILQAEARGTGFHSRPDDVRELQAPLPGTLEEAVVQINAEMERLIRECPGQYLWSYNRYKTPRAGTEPA